MAVSKFIDLKDQQIGDWEVLHFLGTINGIASWYCRCSCGIERAVNGSNLRRGRSLGCGCKKNERIGIRALRHGHAQGIKPTPEYVAWRRLLARCHDKNHEHYKDYGARGIIVCDQWRTCFSNFFTDMGAKPGKQYSVHRKDNNGNYCKENCEWADVYTQQNNRRNNRCVTYAGKTKTISEWSRITGIGMHALYHRLNKGWSAERMLTTPSSRRPNLFQNSH